MYATEKLNLLGKLVNIGQEHPSLEGEMIEMIAKVAAPPVVTAPPIFTHLPSAKQPLSPTIDELHLARTRGRIGAIKVYRTRTGLDLRTSKENIERALKFLGWENEAVNVADLDYICIVEDLEPMPF